MVFGLFCALYDSFCLWVFCFVAFVVEFFSFWQVILTFVGCVLVCFFKGSILRFKRLLFFMDKTTSFFVLTL